MKHRDRAVITAELDLHHTELAQQREDAAREEAQFLADLIDADDNYQFRMSILRGQNPEGGSFERIEDYREAVDQLKPLSREESREYASRSIIIEDLITESEDYRRDVFEGALDDYRLP